jgi:hypothetical protein
MSDTETLSAEDKAYFDTRGETTVTAPAAIADDTLPDDDLPIETHDELDETGSETPPVDDVVDPDKATGQTKVPFAALTKERNERKAVAAKLAETERRAAILEDRWTQLLSSREAESTPASVQPAAEPDLSNDPMAIVNKLWTESQDQRKQRETEAQQTKEQAAANEAWGKTMNVARAQYQAACAADEAFEPTYTALRANMGQEYMELYGLSETEAKAEVDRYEAQQIAYAVDRGIDISVHMRKLAKTRNITVAPKTAPDRSAGEILDKLAEGVNGSTSLSTAGGGRVAATNAQSIADMSPDEFANWLGKDGNQAKFKKLAGG